MSNFSATATTTAPADRVLAVLVSYDLRATPAGNEIGASA